uniref:Floricaula/leafy-like transcription factor n=1 Tax=Cylindrocystis sp. EM-2014 TaxID=1464125 RepID=W8ELI3_9VIRI|nr:CyLFY [Cylindrocystis sp. EM-2014]
MTMVVDRGGEDDPGLLHRWSAPPPEQQPGVMLINVGRKPATTLEELFRDNRLRSATLQMLNQMGFSVGTLVNLTEAEVDYVVRTIRETQHVDLPLGEQLGIKAGIRAERRYLEDFAEKERMVDQRRRQDSQGATTANQSADHQSMGGPARGDHGHSNDGMGFATNGGAPDGALNLGVLQHVVSGGDSMRHSDVPLDSDSEEKSKKRKRKKKGQLKAGDSEDGDEEPDGRPREHPFQVTERGEEARGKRNGLDHLFELYEEAGQLLVELQQTCSQTGAKWPTKVNNQVFRYAKAKGMGHINKPKMRQYVHCYALHCLDVVRSDDLRREFKFKSEAHPRPNVGTWSDACYAPLVQMSRDNNWDVDSLFENNEKLRIWYVPKK